jgi:peptidoglycan/LPS O-acetylase OafA/YrhL
VLFVRYLFWGWYLHSPNATDRPDVLFYLAIAFMIVALTMMFSAKLWQQIVDNRLFLFLSVISYNLYLYHLVISMSLVYRVHFPSATTAVPQMDPHWQLMFIVVAALTSILVATLVTYSVERPFLRSGKSLLIKVVFASRVALSRLALWGLRQRPSLGE